MQSLITARNYTTSLLKCHSNSGRIGIINRVKTKNPNLTRVSNSITHTTPPNNLNNASSTITSMQRYLSSSTKATITRKTVTPEQRAALRQARKERATAEQQSNAHNSTGTNTAGSFTASTKAGGGGGGSRPYDPRIVFGLGIAIPTFVLAWGVFDENSPPAKFASMLGFDEFFDSFAKPNEDKLLPNWHDMKDVPKDFQPMTLVIDLENTLVNSSWDRKHGWRTAKRPGAIKFIRELAQYYEIVLYTPSNSGLAFPVIEALQIESGGGIMHILFREHCYYKNGSYMKDLSRLNRNLSRVILIDDDEKAAALNPENLIKVKPYTDPADRKDDTLERLIPFLIEIATENYSDARVVLGQFRGMDADGIVDELEQRVSRVQNNRINRGGLGSWSNAGRMDMPTPEMAPVDRSRRRAGGGISSKDLVGEGPSSSGGMNTTEKGLSGWLQKRQEKQAREKMEKMEHWNQLMMERVEEKRKQEEA